MKKNPWKLELHKSKVERSDGFWRELSSEV